jgi:hypothetical protein
MEFPTTVVDQEELAKRVANLNANDPLRKSKRASSKRLKSLSTLSMFIFKQKQHDINSPLGTSIEASKETLSSLSPTESAVSLHGSVETKSPDDANSPVMDRKSGSMREDFDFQPEQSSSVTRSSTHSTHFSSEHQAEDEVLSSNSYDTTRSESRFLTLFSESSPHINEGTTSPSMRLEIDTSNRSSISVEELGSSFSESVTSASSPRSVTFR